MNKDITTMSMLRKENFNSNGHQFHQQ